MSEKRGVHYKWADVMRAVLICCLVFGHGSDGLDHSIIYLFHMPCFLILSGYLSSDERFSTKFLKRKASQLLVPYVVYELATELLFYKTPFSLAIFYTLYGSGRIRGGGSVVFAKFLLDGHCLLNY